MTKKFKMILVYSSACVLGLTLNSAFATDEIKQELEDKKVQPLKKEDNFSKLPNDLKSEILKKVIRQSPNPSFLNLVCPDWNMLLNTNIKLVSKYSITEEFYDLPYSEKVKISNALKSNSDLECLEIKSLPENILNDATKETLNIRKKYSIVMNLVFYDSLENKSKLKKLKIIGSLEAFCVCNYENYKTYEENSENIFEDSRLGYLLNLEELTVTEKIRKEDGADFKLFTEVVVPAMPNLKRVTAENFKYVRSEQNSN